MPDPPNRIQRRRTKGYKTPPNTVYCGRPGPWGNPFTHSDPAVSIEAFRLAALAGSCWGKIEGRIVSEINGKTYRGLFLTGRLPEWWFSNAVEMNLRGKNLSCWCKLCDRHKDGKPLDEECAECSPCHVDVIGENLYGPLKGNP
jgi:hypothetical protein